jgi:hypothetical protein
MKDLESLALDKVEKSSFPISDGVSEDPDLVFACKEIEKRRLKLNPSSFRTKEKEEKK